MRVGAESRQMAVVSLSTMHRRFARDSKLAEAYRNFMAEYERLGYMTRIPDSEIRREDVLAPPRSSQASNSNWKLRVVFDASRRTRDGHFLNNFYLQVLRFRVIFP